MKMIRYLMVLLVGILILNSCHKDDSRPWDENQSYSVNADTLVVHSDFDWKTTKKYQITIKGGLNHFVKITTADSVVYQKVFLKAGTDYITKLTLPAYEKNIRLIYNNTDTLLFLSSPTLTYSF